MNRRQSNSIVPWSYGGVTPRRPSRNSASSQATVFDMGALMDLAVRGKQLYADAAPFPHIVIRNAGARRAIEACAKAFPSVSDPCWFSYPVFDRTQHNKQVMWNTSQIPFQVLNVISELNSEPFLIFLKALTGVRELVPDPTLYGGGMHQTANGGWLDLHVDHDFNPNLQLYRRVSVLLYLSSWRAEYGGNLELWEGYRDQQDNLVRCTRSVVPNFNTMVIFTNSETSYHGYPEPIRCPSNLTRKSLAIYYCSTEKHPSYSKTAHHRARFVRLPGTRLDKPSEEWYKERASF